MNSRLILERQVEVWAGRVVGTVAFPGPRAELLPVLLCVRDHEETNAEQVAKHLLFSQDGRRRVAERLLRSAEGLGLVIRDGRTYTLTEGGQRAASEEQVFVPQEGAWTIHASPDPLLPSPILQIDSWRDPSAFNEAGPGGRQREFSRRPHYIAAGATSTVALLTGELRVDHLEDQVEATSDDGDRLRLRWDVHQGGLRLEGRLANTEVAVDVEGPRPNADDIWRELLEGENLWHRWHADKKALQTAFADTNDFERRTMARAFTFDRPWVADYGRFDPITTDVRLAPVTDGDADRWARWRLTASVSQYATTARFNDWREKAAAAFREFPVRLPSRAALLETLADADMPQEINRWHLIAAEDWSL